MKSKNYNELNRAPWSFIMLGMGVFLLFWVIVGNPGEDLTVGNVLWRIIPGVVVGGPIIVFGVWLRMRMKRFLPQHGSKGN